MARAVTDLERPDPLRCVLCGAPNDCALAREEGADAEPCWCVAESFPTDLVTSIARDRNQDQCLCRACLIEHLAAGTKSPESSIGSDGR